MTSDDLVNAVKHGDKTMLFNAAAAVNRETKIATLLFQARTALWREWVEAGSQEAKLAFEKTDPAKHPTDNSSTIRPIRLWAAVDPKGRFSLSCLYASLEDAQSDRDVLVREHGWRIVHVRVVEDCRAIPIL